VRFPVVFTHNNRSAGPRRFCGDLRPFAHVQITAPPAAFTVFLHNVQSQERCSTVPRPRIRTVSQGTGISPAQTPFCPLRLLFHARSLARYFAARGRHVYLRHLDAHQDRYLSANQQGLASVLSQFGRAGSTITSSICVRNSIKLSRTCMRIPRSKAWLETSSIGSGPVQLGMRIEPVRLKWMMSVFH